MPDTLDPDNRRDVHGVIFHCETLTVDVCFCLVFFSYHIFYEFRKCLKTLRFRRRKYQTFPRCFNVFLNGYGRPQIRILTCY